MVGHKVGEYVRTYVSNAGHSHMIIYIPTLRGISYLTVAAAMAGLPGSLCRDSEQQPPPSAGAHFPPFLLSCNVVLFA